MQKYITRQFVLQMFIWAAIILAFAGYDTFLAKRQVEQNLLAQARTLSQSIDIAQEWNSSHNGVYVPVTKTTPVNPYFEMENREIYMSEGKQLTLMNPAYMTRQLCDLSISLENIKFHLSSPLPINPINAAYEWEQELFEKVAIGDTRAYAWSKTKSDDGKTYFRYMSSVWVQESCLDCHLEQGYKVGDLRGGLSVSIPTDGVLADLREMIYFHWFYFFVIWALGFIGAFISNRRLVKTAKERNALMIELKASLDEIKTLRGLLPICAKCKNIRDEEGVWNRIEKYFSQHFDAGFTHSYCPDCIRELYPDVADDVLVELDSGDK